MHVRLRLFVVCPVYVHTRIQGQDSQRLQDYLACSRHPVFIAWKEAITWLRPVFKLAVSAYCSYSSYGWGEQRYWLGPLSTTSVAVCVCVAAGERWLTKPNFLLLRARKNYRWWTPASKLPTSLTESTVSDCLSHPCMPMVLCLLCAISYQPRWPPCSPLASVGTTTTSTWGRNGGQNWCFPSQHPHPSYQAPRKVKCASLCLEREICSLFPIFMWCPEPPDFLEFLWRNPATPA